MDFEIRHQPSYALLAVVCGFDGIFETWDRVNADRTSGAIASNLLPLAAVGAAMTVDAELEYVAGIPAAPNVFYRDYRRVQVPPGRYAVIPGPADFSQIGATFEALTAAVREAGHQPGERVELYYGPPDGHPDRYDLGVRLVPPPGDGSD